MSASSGTAEPESWRITLPCTRAEAEALASATELFATLDEPPVIDVREPDEARPDDWLLDAYTLGEPDAEAVAAVRALIASTGAEPEIAAVPPQDWVTMSQAGLEPIRAGRFVVHTPAHAAAVGAREIGLEIAANRAFGTGHHATTAGCLETLDALKRRGRRFAAVADVGTGTGLLAFAALKLWPRARALATDIDPVSIEITLDNAVANQVRIGDGRGRLVAAVAEGVAHPLYEAMGPFDLVVANILAQPLIELAPGIASVIAPGGALVLAGLMSPQAAAVSTAYVAQGFRRAGAIERGAWTILEMRMRR
ncbi:50S ribosomal protein L11 methyltransferase [Sphingomonas sp.]|uniref:50S ribosomal protein L11 methyltransferase n=1 Tax=Sphingomonas sp. TaxID=28214 RepID=UPI003B006D5B